MVTVRPGADCGDRAPLPIAIFAKAPQAGAAKTRLIPALGTAGAARLSRMLSLNAIRLGASFSPQALTLWCAPDSGHRFFRALRARCGISVRSQVGDELGARMAHAFADQRGPLLLIGTDTPALRVEHLIAASTALRGGDDAVFIPAEDGGYVLVGLRRPQPRIFEDIAWGSALVMAQTRERLREAGLRWSEPLTLWDVDEPADLQRLASIAGFSRWRANERQK